MLQLAGVHLLSSQGREPLCQFETGGGRVLLSPATLVDDKMTTCSIPPIPDTTEPNQ
jgi:hypothetical protein